MGKLTTSQVKHAKPGRHGDGRGLYLQVIGGSKTWVLRYEHQKRERWMGLGSVEFVTLAQARERAFELRRQLKTGHRPAGASPGRRGRGAPYRAQAGHLRGGGVSVRRGEVTRNGRATARGGSGFRRLSRYAFPIIGSFSVASIDTGIGPPGARSRLDEEAPRWAAAP